MPERKFGSERAVGFVRFWSRERLDFGVNAIPTLVLNHASLPTSLVNFFSSLFAFLSALVLAVGLYEAFHKIRRKRKDES